MVVVGHLVMLAVRVAAAPGQVEQMSAANEQLQPFVFEALAQAVPNQAGGDCVEYLAQGEPAGAGHGDDDFLVVRGLALGLLLQIRALSLDAFATGGIVTADDLTAAATAARSLRRPRAKDESMLSSASSSQAGRAFSRPFRTMSVNRAVSFRAVASAGSAASIRAPWIVSA